MSDPPMPLNNSNHNILNSLSLSKSTFFKLKIILFCLLLLNFATKNYLKRWTFKSMEEVLKNLEENLKTLRKFVKNQ